MPAGKLDLVIEQGATFRRSVFWEAGEPPAAIDLTGASARLVIRSRMRGQLLSVLSSAPGGGLELNGPAGRIDMHMSAAATAALPAIGARYALEVTRGAEVTRLLEGDAKIAPGFEP